jgi:hypothetical protein
MSVLANLSGIIQTAEFQQDYQVAIREQARQHNSFIAYLDEQGRLVREYPATGKLYEVSTTQKTLTLFSVRGVAVVNALPIPLSGGPPETPAQPQQ